MRIIKKISGTCSEIAGRISMLTVFILLVLTVCDVIGRFVFNSPIPGTFELTRILFALSVFFSFSLSQYKGENLGITILYDKYPLRLKGIIDLFSVLISIAMFSVAFYQMLKYAGRMMAVKQVTSVLRWPVYPWIYFASIGLVTLVIALLWDLVVSIKKIMGETTDES